MDRINKIKRTSLIGIVVNFLLGIIKIIIGITSNSISITSDAINNFSDSISSIITILTMKIAAKGATKNHPFGFGRVEYFSGAIIASLVLITGVEFLKISINRIFNSQITNYNYLAVTILIISILAKLILGRYTKKIGKENNSLALVASGEDSINDSIITGVTLLGAIITIVTSYNLDGILGFFVSLVVLKSGIEILWDIISKLLGERNNVELAKTLINELKKSDEIIGAYDLILHNYGPEMYIADVNVELRGSLTIREAYSTIKPLRVKIYQEYGVLLYIGFYSVNRSDKKVIKIENEVKALILDNPLVLQVHAFTIYEELNILAFDVVVDFDCKDIPALKQIIINRVEEKFPNYKVKTTLEKDFSVSK